MRKMPFEVVEVMILRFFIIYTFRCYYYLFLLSLVNCDQPCTVIVQQHSSLSEALINE